MPETPTTSPSPSPTDAPPEFDSGSVIDYEKTAAVASGEIAFRFLNCSWCQKVVNTTQERCQYCGHNPQLPRILCDCDECHIFSAARIA